VSLPYIDLVAFPRALIPIRSFFPRRLCPSATLFCRCFHHADTCTGTLLRVCVVCFSIWQCPRHDCTMPLCSYNDLLSRSAPGYSHSSAPGSLDLQNCNAMRVRKLQSRHCVRHVDLREHHHPMQLEQNSNTINYSDGCRPIDYCV
jgi:hypothetical protein